MKISITKNNRGYNQKTWQTMVKNKFNMFCFLNLPFVSLTMLFVVKLWLHATTDNKNTQKYG